MYGGVFEMTYIKLMNRKGNLISVRSIKRGFRGGSTVTEMGTWQALLIFRSKDVFELQIFECFLQF